jgi:gas vesicle protein
MANHKSSNWFVTGLSVGAVAAILFAPKSGRETRRAIATGVNNGVRQLSNLGRDARERVRSTAKLLVRKKEEAGAALHNAKQFLKRVG